MTYIQQKAEEIAKHSGMDIQEDGDLCLLYAVLALSKGRETTLKDVHEAWAAWKHLRGIHEHKSLIPFEELTPEVQELGRRYMEAIHASVNATRTCTACPPVFLRLEEFTSGGSKYIRCTDDGQRPLLSHLLNGGGACFFAEELPKVQMIANAHGWVIHLILENAKLSHEEGGKAPK